MISQYSKAEDIDREFWQDYERALYWLRKKMDAKKSAHEAGRRRVGCL